MALHRQRPALDEHVDTRLLHERVLYRKERPVLTINFRSTETSTNGQPVFSNEDTIEGTVQLLNTKKVERVTFQGKGIIVAPDMGAENVFWSSEEVHEHPISVSSLLRRLIRRSFKVFTGSHSWRFSLKLPSRVLVRAKGHMAHCPLPPTYRPAYSSGMLEYQLVISAYRGVLRESYKLAVPFIYIPRSTPEYPLWRTTSHQSDVAEVEEGYVDISPIGPRRVPGGSFGAISFEELPTLVQQRSIQGVTIGGRRVLVTVQAIYHNPPILALDAPVRISLSFQSDDPQVLDFLISDSCLQAQLEQQATFGRDQTNADVLCRASIYRDRPPVPGANRQRLPIQRKAELVFNCPPSTCPSFSFPGLNLQHFIVVQVTASGFFAPVAKHIPPMRFNIQLVTNSVLS